MTHFKDPPRLTEPGEGPFELARLLQRAQDDSPTAIEIEQLLRGAAERLASLAEPSGALLPEALPATRPGSGPDTSGRGSGAAKLPLKALTVVAVAGIGLGTWLLAGRDERAAQSVQTSRPAVTASSGARRGAGSVGVGSVGVGSVGTGTRSTAVPSAPASLGSRERPSASGDAGASATKAEPRALVAVRGAASAHTEKSRGVGGTTEADEYALLREARNAVSAAPARAVALTEEHARRFPGGMLSQEREAIAIEALMHLGKTSQATSRAQRFLRAYPGSPYETRIESAVRRSAGSEKKP